MVTFLQRTFTSLVHAHAGRTQGLPADAVAYAPAPLKATLVSLRAVMITRKSINFEDFCEEYKPICKFNSFVVGECYLLRDCAISFNPTSLESLDSKYYLQLDASVRNNDVCLNLLHLKGSFLESRPVAVSDILTLENQGVQSVVESTRYDAQQILDCSSSTKSAKHHAKISLARTRDLLRYLP